MLGLMLLVLMSFSRMAQRPEPAAVPELPRSGPLPDLSRAPALPPGRGGPLDQVIRPTAPGADARGNAGAVATRPLEGTKGDWSIEEVETKPPSSTGSGVTLRLPAQPAVPKRNERTEKGDWSIEEVETKQP
jgi:hypothetical protein